MKPGSSTVLAGVIGSPVRHSRSPRIHNAAFEHLGLDWVYLAFDVPSGQAHAALAAMRALNVAGLSVTMPHKDDIARLVDEPSPAVTALGACNCVQLLADGRTAGHNTDGDGLIDAVRHEAGVDVAGRRAVVLGAGGAARAVVDALARAGCSDVAVVNRTAANAERAAMLAGPVGRVGRLGDVVDAEIIVNATSVGMGARPDSRSDEDIPLDPRVLQAGQLVVDIVYQPLQTPLLAAAAQRGATPLDGLHMLVYQAARQFRIWTGVEPPVGVMNSAARNLAE